MDGLLLNLVWTEGEEFGLYLWTAITTGARRGEVSALRENRFDFARQQRRCEPSVRPYLRGGSILRQSVSVLGQEGPMVCLCGPAAHRGNAPRAMARWRPTRDVECQLKSYCGRRIPGHDPLSASRVAGGRPIGGPAP